LRLAAAAGMIEAQRQPGNDLNEADWAIISARIEKNDVASEEEAIAFFAKYTSA
jgi:hypothetical protein